MTGEAIGEIRDILKPDVPGDFRNGPLRLEQQQLGLFKPVFGQIVDRCHAINLLHAPCNVVVMKIERFGHRIARQFGAVIVFNKGLGLLRECDGRARIAVVLT